MSTKGLLALRAFRGIAIAAPLAGAAASAGVMLEQNYQRALCAHVPGADFIGEGIGLLNVAILAAPWLVIAACQLVGRRKPLRLSDVWRLIVIAFTASYGLLLVEYYPPPVADAMHCSLAFWRHHLAEVLLYEMATMPMAAISLAVATIAYINISRAKARAPAQEKMV